MGTAAMGVVDAGQKLATAAVVVVVVALAHDQRRAAGSGRRLAAPWRPGRDWVELGGECVWAARLTEVEGVTRKLEELRPTGLATSIISLAELYEGHPLLAILLAVVRSLPASTQA